MENELHPDPTKQVIFSRKAKEIYHPLLVIDICSVFQTSPPKHQSVILDNKLIFDEHIKMDF